MVGEAKFPETKNQGDTDYQSGAIIPDFKVLNPGSKKIDGSNGAQAGMFHLYRKKEDVFVAREFKAIPLYWTPYSVIWDPNGKFSPGAPPFLVSVYDENTSIRWNPTEKKYEQGPLIAGDPEKNVPPIPEEMAKYLRSGLLLYLILEDGKVGKMFLQYKDLENFREVVGNAKSLSPILVKSVKSKNKQGQTVYRIEFETTNSSPYPSAQVHVDRAKQEVSNQVDLQHGITHEEEGVNTN